MVLDWTWDEDRHGHVAFLRCVNCGHVPRPRRPKEENDEASRA